jgi:CcmD family protein
MESLYNFLDKNPYYVILLIALIIFAGIFSYVINLSKKASKLEKK